VQVVSITAEFPDQFSPDLGMPITHVFRMQSELEPGLPCVLEGQQTLAWNVDLKKLAGDLPTRPRRWRASVQLGNGSEVEGKWDEAIVKGIFGEDASINEVSRAPDREGDS
jgi:hypothetical protein